MEMMKVLLEYNANPSIVVKSERYSNHIVYKTPLTEAIKNDNFEIVKMLVENGADINYRDEFGVTPSVIALRWAVDAYYKFDSSITDYLIFDKNADLSGTNSYTVSDREEGIFRENVELLRGWLFDINSPEYLMKLKYIEKFQEYGQDYYSTEIQPYILREIKENYSDEWEEYIKIY